MGKWGMAIGKKADPQPASGMKPPEVKGATTATAGMKALASSFGSVSGGGDGASKGPSMASRGWGNKIRQLQKEESWKPLVLQTSTTTVMKARNKDAKFAEVHNEVTSKEKERKQDKKVDKDSHKEEYYVDSYRSFATKLGGGTEDLKDSILMSGLKLKSGELLMPGEPNDQMYLKQAEYLIRIGRYPAALQYLKYSLDHCLDQSGKTMKDTQAALAKCHLIIGNWNLAEEAAEKVLKLDPHCVKGVFIKAEALYYNCNFEKAMVMYHQGMRWALDPEDFRLGVQKCRKTIEDCIGSNDTFTVRGVQAIFNIIRRKVDMNSGETRGKPPSTNIKLGKVTMGDVSNVLATKTQAERKTKMDLAARREARLRLERRKEYTDDPVELKMARKEKYGGGTKKFKSLMKVKMSGMLEQQQDALTDEIPELADPIFSEAIRKASMHHRDSLRGEKCCNRRCTPEERLECQKRVSRRCRQKAREFMTSDRLLEDKNYLINLASPGGIGVRTDVEEDCVVKDVMEEATSVLRYLQLREEFWSQLDMGKNREQILRKEKAAKKIAQKRK